MTLRNWKAGPGWLRTVFASVARNFFHVKMYVMDDKRRTEQPDENLRAPRSSGSDAGEEQTISVGQQDNLQDDENFYQNRERGNMPQGDSRSEEGGGTLF